MRIAYFTGAFPGKTSRFNVPLMLRVAKGYNEVTLFVSSNIPREYCDDAGALVGASHMAEYSLSNLGKGGVILEVIKYPISFGLYKAFKDVHLLLSIMGAARYRAIIISLCKIGRLRRMFGRLQEYDVIHVQFGNLLPIVYPLIRDRLIAGKLVVSIRGADVTRWRSKWKSKHYDELLRRSDILLPVCEHLKNKLLAIGVPSYKTVILPTPIDERALRGRSDGQLEQCKIYSIVSVGRLVEKKGFEYIIDAIALLVRGGERVRLRIVGSGPLRAALENKVTSLGIESSVSFMGHLPHSECLALMVRSNLLINHSITAADGDSEGIPNVLKEALALRVPVIASIHAGNPELIKHQRTGCLVKERDIEGIAQAIRFMKENPETVRDMVENGVNKVNRDYSLDRVYDSLIDVYQRNVCSP